VYIKCSCVCTTALRSIGWCCWSDSAHCRRHILHAVDVCNHSLELTLWGDVKLHMAHVWLTADEMDVGTEKQSACCFWCHTVYVTHQQALYCNSNIQDMCGVNFVSLQQRPGGLRDSATAPTAQPSAKRGECEQCNSVHDMTLLAHCQLPKHVKGVIVPLVCDKHTHSR
jgi:hypothetical protein